MKQSELIALIGLKSTDPKLVDFFNKYNFEKPPKSINANQGSKRMDDKPSNLSFSFNYDIINDSFQPPISPKNDDYNFVAYLSGVNFFAKDISAKKPDPKPKDFWDISPKTINAVEVLTKTLGNPIEETDKIVSFEKSLTNDIALAASYNVKEQLLTQCWVSIKTHYEIISHSFFKKDCEILGKTAALNAMLIKWLFDNRFLKLNEAVYSEKLKNETDKVLVFIKAHLKNHLWDTQITETPFLRRFLSTTHQNNSGLETENGEKVMFYYRDILFKSIGIFTEYERLYKEDFEKADQLVGQIPFNDDNYSKFSKGMSENFEWYKKLKVLEINKEWYE